MNVKRFLLASLAVFITFQVLDFIIHNLILGPAYEATMQLWRPDMMEKMWIMYVMGALMSLVFVYFFAKGNQGKGIAEGLKYGLIMGVLIAIVIPVNQYIIYPLPGDLVLKWVLFGYAETIVAAVVAALVYKPS